VLHLNGTMNDVIVIDLDRLVDFSEFDKRSSIEIICLEHNGRWYGDLEPKINVVAQIMEKFKIAKLTLRTEYPLYHPECFCIMSKITTLYLEGICIHPHYIDGLFVHTNIKEINFIRCSIFNSAFNSLFFQIKTNYNVIITILDSRYDYNDRIQGVERYNVRNLAGYQKCRSAIITLIGLKQKKGNLLSTVPKDLINLLVKLIYKTFGTKVWAVAPPP
jgi:hypothetical protein